jgi:hypothetical protein
MGLIVRLETAKGCHKVFDLADRRGFAEFEVALNGAGHYSSVSSEDSSFAMSISSQPTVRSSTSPASGSPKTVFMKHAVAN